MAERASSIAALRSRVRAAAAAVAARSAAAASRKRPNVSRPTWAPDTSAISAAERATPPAARSPAARPLAVSLSAPSAPRSAAPAIVCACAPRTVAAAPGRRVPAARRAVGLRSEKTSASATPAGAPASAARVSLMPFATARSIAPAAPSAPMTGDFAGPRSENLPIVVPRSMSGRATGLVYFTFRTLYRDGAFLQDRWEDVCAAAGSVRPFVPVILSDEEPPSVTGATDDLSVRAWRHQGYVYLAAVNNTRDPVRGEIGLDVPVAAVEPLLGAAGGCELSSPRTVRVSLDGLGVAVLRASVLSDAAHLRAIHADGRRNRGHD